METTVPRRSWLNILALLLVSPSVYFVVAAILKYEVGMNGPFDAAAPLLERMGLQEPPGWNINLLILFGPVIALLIAVSQVLRTEWYFSKEKLQFRFTLKKQPFPIGIIFLSGLVMGILFIYLVGENCGCHNR